MDIQYFIVSKYLIAGYIDFKNLNNLCQFFDSDEYSKLKELDKSHYISISSNMNENLILNYFRGSYYPVYTNQSSFLEKEYVKFYENTKKYLNKRPLKRKFEELE